MTPLIAEMVGVIPKIAADMMWFDIDEIWQPPRQPYSHNMAIKELQQPLPFIKCAITFMDESKAKVVVIVSEAIRKDTSEKGLAMAAVALFKGQVNAYAPFFCNPFNENDGAGITIFFDDKKHDSDPQMEEAAKVALVAVSHWLNTMNKKSIVSYHPQPKPSHAKRIRQGKKPMFDWHTVVLEPRSAQESEALGGTHSSPRLHDVRGHWVVRGSKRFWRKPHKRGDASKGVIFHDYKLKGERHDHV
jgi:hypothetical protein